MEEYSQGDDDLDVEREIPAPLEDLYHEGAYLRYYRNKSVVSYQFWALFWIAVFIVTICGTFVCGAVTVLIPLKRAAIEHDIFQEQRSATSRSDRETNDEVFEVVFVSTGCGSTLFFLLMIASYRLYAKNRRLARLQAYLIKADRVLKPIVNQLQA